jgi:hypothetical protein
MESLLQIYTSDLAARRFRQDVKMIVNFVRKEIKYNRIKVRRNRG